MTHAIRLEINLFDGADPDPGDEFANVARLVAVRDEKGEWSVRAIHGTGSGFHAGNPIYRDGKQIAEEVKLLLGGFVPGYPDPSEK